MAFVDKIARYDAFAAECGIKLVEIDNEHATVQAPITPATVNADGVAQGGFLYTVADLAFAYLVNHLHPRTVTQSASITYVAPGTGRYVQATARQLSQTKRNCVVQVTVQNDEGTMLAVLQINGFIAPQ